MKRKTDSSSWRERSSHRLWRCAAIIVTVVLAIGVASAAQAREWHNAATPIKLGGIFVTSGAPTLVSLPILSGYRLAFAQANALGGISGHRIQYLTEDDGYNPSNTTPAARKLVESDGVLAIAGVFGSDDSNAVIPYLDGAKVPFVDPIGGGANVAHKSWVWQSEPSYALEGKVIAGYIARSVHHVRRVSVVYQVGANEPEIAAMRKVLAKKHIGMTTVSYSATTQDMSAQISQVQGYNPDMVVLLGTPLPTSIFVKQAAAVGYTPKHGYFANYPEGDPGWLGLTRPYAEGSLVSSYADLTGNNPVAKAYRAALVRYGKHGKFGGYGYSNYGLYGYFNAGLVLRALRIAGPKTNRAHLQSVLDTRFRKFRSGFTGVLNWTLSYRYGVKQFKVYRISGSRFKPITGWISS
jgi:ABC-type branched-subunit amino acid transport system substrate-binding protein